MRKKYIVGIFPIVMLMTLVLACSKRSAETQQLSEVILYHNKIEINEQLTAYANYYSEQAGVDVLITSCGGGCPYSEQLKAEFQSDKQPDIFVIAGQGDYEVWKTKIIDLSDSEWSQHTDLAFALAGKVYGFPVAVEGWGMAYNTAILAKANVDPASLTSLAAYRTAFATIDAMKDELGLKAVVSMAAGPEMRWVTGLHNFNGYLASGLAYGDTQVLDKLNNGEVDEQRLADYVDWVELLFQYSDRSDLLVGNYDAQVGAFGTEQTAFVHQGNWIDPWLAENNVTFAMAYAPHAAVGGLNDSLFIGAPSYYVINKDSPNVEAAKAFLTAMATTPEGHNYMVNEAKMVPAFKNVSLEPTAPLSAEIAHWLKAGKSYTWLQNDMPDGFGMRTLGPMYTSFANGDLSKSEFKDYLQGAIEDLK